MENYKIKYNQQLTYGELTRSVLKEEPKKGNSKVKQMKQIESQYRITQIGRKYIIEEKYDTPKPIEDLRGGNNVGHFKQYKELSIDKSKYKSIGVYRIINYTTNEIYIGSTISCFRDRFFGHYHGKNHKNMKHTYNLLQKKNTYFEIVEEMNNSTEEEIRVREQYYIDLYKNDEKYTLINHRNEIKPKVKKNKVTKSKVKNKKPKVKTKEKYNKEKKYPIWISKSNYLKAVELLHDNNLITNEKYNEMMNKFDNKN